MMNQSHIHVMVNYRERRL